MGQYYLIVNLDKKQYLSPSHCGDGIKLMEFACSAQGTLAALAILLADGNNRGGGDLRSTNEIIGSWAGDRIVVTGDYADEGRFTDDPHQNLYCAVEGARKVGDPDGNHGSDWQWETYASEYVDVSYHAMHALMDDAYIREDTMERLEKEPWQKETIALWFNPPPLKVPHRK